MKMKKNIIFRRLLTFAIASFMCLSTVSIFSVTSGEPGVAHVVDGVISAGEYDGGMAVQLVGKTDPTWTVDAYIDWDDQYLYVAVDEPVPPGGGSWIEFAIDTPTWPYLRAFTLFGNGNQHSARNLKPSGTWHVWPYSFLAASSTDTEFRVDYTDFLITEGDTIKMSIDRNDGTHVPPPPRYTYGFAAFWPAGANVYDRGRADPTTWGDVTLSPSILSATIDIKPGSCPNSINPKSKGKIPVAILTTEDFDASTVDPDTVVFLGASPLRWAMEDVDGDDDIDMILHFKTQGLDFTLLVDEGGDYPYAYLTGETTDGIPFEGKDTVRKIGNYLQILSRQTFGSIFERILHQHPLIYQLFQRLLKL